jgi:ankyrin repeat protein
MTPLMSAVLAGVSAPLSMHFKIVDLLVRAGADVNASVDISPLEKDNPVRTMTSLHWSVAKGAKFLDMTLLLLEEGANPNAPGAWGRPLHIAAGSKNVHSDSIALLLKWGADVDETNQWGNTPLVEAVTAEAPSREKIELLLDAGADINATFDWAEDHGLSVLMAAAMNGTPDIVQLLLDRGARKNVTSDKGLSPRDYALRAERLENADLLWW